MFAKLYETKKYGQILVKLEADEEDKPEIRVYFEDRENGLGVCSSGFQYDDWDTAEELLQKTDEESCVAVVENLKRMAGIS